MLRVLREDNVTFVRGDYFHPSIPAASGIVLLFGFTWSNFFVSLFLSALLYWVYKSVYKELAIFYGREWKVERRTTLFGHVVKEWERSLSLGDLSLRRVESAADADGGIEWYIHFLDKGVRFDQVGPFGNEKEVNKAFEELTFQLNGFGSVVH